MCVGGSMCRRVHSRQTARRIFCRADWTRRQRMKVLVRADWRGGGAAPADGRPRPPVRYTFNPVTLSPPLASSLFLVATGVRSEPTLLTGVRHREHSRSPEDALIVNAAGARGSSV